MTRDSQWKLIQYPEIDRWQLFDLIADPNELNDLSGNPTQAELLKRLHKAA